MDSTHFCFVLSGDVLSSVVLFLKYLRGIKMVDGTRFGRVISTVDCIRNRVKLCVVSGVGGLATNTTAIDVSRKTVGC